MNYEAFLHKKIKHHVLSGFNIVEGNLNKYLFPFQEYIVKKALSAGKYAVFADCGLGKTLMQLEWANQVAIHAGKPVLILTPLAVSGQTIQEGQKFGIEVVRYNGSDAPIQITNYEQIENINCGMFSGIVLDESGILKNFEGAIKTKVIELFRETPYKLCCTATPSPNDPMELGNHSEFLDVMSRNEMLAMYFIHDGGETSKWRIKKHAVDIFYRWVGTWAIMLNNPADIGYPMGGFDLPQLNILDRQIVTPKRNNGKLFNETAISATDFNQELRLTIDVRMNEVADIVNGSSDNFIVWIKHNQEGDVLKKLIPCAVEVKGSDTPEYKEQKLLGFANNDFRVLITKSKIAQFGMNYQNCHNQIFASLDFSFESLYQSIRRSYRFGQKHEVNIYLITTDTMQNVIESINRKQEAFKMMQDKMCKMVDVDLNGLSAKDYDDEDVKNEYYHIRRGDCCELIKDVRDESIGLSIFSPPFASLYTYSSNVEDMGNSANYNEFVEHFGYLIQELYRVLMQGRNIAIHCMDLPIQKGKEGFIGLRDFSGMILKVCEYAGLIYHSRVTIWKDPVTEMQRTKALGLLHKQIKKDATMSRVGLPDYVMIFRKDGDRNNPVNCNIPVELWQKYASPVWMDINYSDTLQFRNARDNNDERHICPLQLQTIERLIHLYSNEGDTILTPFAGIGSEVYEAVRLNRKGIGFELKESYFNNMTNNLRGLLEQKNQMDIMELCR